MQQGIVAIIFIVVLSIAEFFCFTSLRDNGFPILSAAVITLTSCLGLFALFAAFFLFRREDSDSSSSFGQSSPNQTSYPNRQTTALRSNRFDSKSHKREDIRLRISADAGRTQEAEGFSRPSVASIEWKTAEDSPLYSQDHLSSDSLQGELRSSLEARVQEYSQILIESAKELSRFDLGVLRTLEKNSPGSAEGVIIAMKLHHAIERRVEDISQLLQTLGPIPTEEGQALLFGDILTPNDDQLSTMFNINPIPPMKSSEAGFHMRVMIKRVARRRSIFRGASEDLLLVRSVRHTLDESSDLPQQQTQPETRAEETHVDERSEDPTAQSSNPGSDPAELENFAVNSDRFDSSASFDSTESIYSTEEHDPTSTDQPESESLHATNS
jgi:hypothetical protein